MTASNGTNFGPYEILALLGAGGMGEVYRARDARLGREVAVKVLPSTFSDNAERLARFEQEACAAGALNHPNILAIYDIGSHEGAPYVVSELLEGETLRDKLDGSPLPQRRAIDYALQIAHGLAAAHEKGIVHRDLKPDNLFVTKDGRVKILDFGLAKLVEPTPLGQVASEAPTRKLKTDSGMVMGTVGYMSPEQVRGQPVDHRSDIFSFGTILYEMLTGRRAFRRESAVETLNAILKEDPPEFSESNEHINPAFERIVNHCLEKRPEQRFHSARDLAFALESLSGTGSITSGQTVPNPAMSGRRVSRREVMASAVAGIVVLAVSVAIYLSSPNRGSDQAPSSISRFQLTPPEKTEFSGPPLISPDGRRLVTRTKDANGKQSLWIRPIDSLEAVPLPGTDDATQPFWSPDSRMIGFFSDLKLKKVDISGGPVQTLSDAVPASGGTWSRDGVIIFGRERQGGLHKVSASGGTATPLTTLDKERKELLHHWPYFLPDGRHFLYSIRSSKVENNGIFVSSIDSDGRKAILPGVDSSMAYAPPGYILFVRENALMAQAFDADLLEATGEAFPIVQKVGFNMTNARAHFSVSETGTLVYRTDIASGDRQLAWCDRTGKQLAAVGERSRRMSVELSPDEKRVAAVFPDQDKPTYNIWLTDLERAGAASRLTFDLSAAIVPIWSHDGRHIAFASTRDGAPNLYLKLSSGAGDDEALVKSDKLAIPNDWSPDGRYILFQQSGDPSGMDLWVLPILERAEPFAYLQTEFAEYAGRFSPDGRWVAYVSNEVGHAEVYVRNFPVSSGKWQVSTTGGGQPRWSSDGKELFYLSAAGKLMAVDVKSTADSLEFGVPKPLFDVRVANAPVGYSYDVSRDGQRFLVNIGIDEAPPSPLIVVTNWLADMKR